MSDLLTGSWAAVPTGDIFVRKRGVYFKNIKILLTYCVQMVFFNPRFLGMANHLGPFPEASDGPEWKCGLTCSDVF